MGTRVKPTTCLTIGLIAGCLFGVMAMLISPSTYYQIAGSISWRLSWPPVIQSHLENMMTTLQLRGDSLVTTGDVVLFGDSHLQAVPAARIVSSVNYAIGGETVQKLARRIGRYSSLSKVSAVVLLAGRNDLSALMTPPEIEQSMSRVLAQIPLTAKVIMVAIPPATDTQHLVSTRLETNQRFKKLCGARETCRFISLEKLAAPDGRLQQDYDSGDGIHLNTKGYETLLLAIKAALHKP